MPVLILVDARPACWPACWRAAARFGLPVHPAPAPYDPLDVGRYAGPSDGEEPGFRLRRGYAGQGAHLGIR